MTDQEFKSRMRRVLESVAVIAPNTVDDDVAAESVIDLAMDAMLRLIDVGEKEQVAFRKFMAAPGVSWTPGDWMTAKLDPSNEETIRSRCSWGATSADPGELIGSAEPPPVRTGRVVYSGLDPKNDNELMNLKADWDGVLKNKGVAEHLS